MTIPSLQVLIMLWFGRRLKTMSSFVDIDPGSAQKEGGGGGGGEVYPTFVEMVVIMVFLDPLANNYYYYYYSPKILGGRQNTCLQFTQETLLLQSQLLGKVLV